MNGRLLTAMSILAFACTLALWSWVLGQTFSPLLNSVCIVGTLICVFPTVVAGRRLLDVRPTPQRAALVTAVVHAVLMALFGVGIVKAIQTAGGWRGLAIPFPHTMATILLYITGAAAILTVLNLALRGWGAPFAVALSRRLATDWLYSRTRNPMVLATLAWLFAAGLWFQSALFLVWVVVLAAPAWVFFVKVYEERELEIRFGAPYRAYREATPFLWPWKRRGRSSQQEHGADERGGRS